mmetsp:Transcript_13691/g.43755  ORF Transcript_13691/g.43755 Transcript_13691/m.43755 type:complete len:906 (-) Transcript_13691:33-2750(-)
MGTKSSKPPSLETRAPGITRSTPRSSPEGISEASTGETGDAVDDMSLGTLFLARTKSVACPPGYAFAFSEKQVPYGEYATVEQPDSSEVLVYRLTPTERATVFPALSLSAAPEFLAIDNICAHKSARLVDGDIEEVGECARGCHLDGSKIAGLCVLCPRHRKKFNNGVPGGGLYFSLLDGHSFTKEDAKKHKDAFRQAIYSTKVENGRVFVSLEPLSAAELRAQLARWRVLTPEGDADVAPDAEEGAAQPPPAASQTSTGDEAKEFDNSVGMDVDAGAAAGGWPSVPLDEEPAGVTIGDVVAAAEADQLSSVAGSDTVVAATAPAKVTARRLPRAVSSRHRSEPTQASTAAASDGHGSSVASPTSAQRAASHGRTSDRGLLSASRRRRSASASSAASAGDGPARTPSRHHIELAYSDDEEQRDGPGSDRALAMAELDLQMLTGDDAVAAAAVAPTATTGAAAAPCDEVAPMSAAAAAELAAECAAAAQRPPSPGGGSACSLSSVESTAGLQAWRVVSVHPHGHSADSLELVLHHTAARPAHVLPVLASAPVPASAPAPPSPARGTTGAAEEAAPQSDDLVHWALTTSAAKGGATDSALAAGGGGGGTERAATAAAPAPAPLPEPPRVDVRKLSSTAPGGVVAASPPSRGVSAGEGVVPCPGTRPPPTPMWHVSIAGPVHCGRRVSRDYTPVSTREEYAQGVLRFVIKVYPLGRLTSWLAEHAVQGAMLDVSAAHPTQSLRPIDRWLPGQDVGDVAGVLLLAGGTGIAPILQCVRSLRGRSPPWLRWALVRSDHTPSDVLLRDEALASMGGDASSTARVWQTLTRSEVQAAPGWNGRLTRDMLQEVVDWIRGTGSAQQTQARRRILVLQCGPQGFCDHCEKLLVDADGSCGGALVASAEDVCSLEA